MDSPQTGWQSVCCCFNKWSRDGPWKQVWVNLLKADHRCLGLSPVRLDGSHTPAKRGRQAVGHQGRKASKTGNALFLSDNTGQMLALSAPQQGQYHDLYGIKTLFAELCGLLKGADINCKGIFLNMGPG